MFRCFFVVALLLSTDFSIAQTAWKSFWQLSGPEKCWVFGHPFIANKARKLTELADSISKEMKYDSLLDGDQAGGQVDAFRHAYWMALLSQNFCWKKAIALGDAHEKGNYKQFKKGITDEEATLPDSVSGVMDIFNNGIGADIGCRYKLLNNDSLKFMIREAVLKGEMKIISKNRTGDFLDCDGNVLQNKSFEGKWNIPKCLITSDLQRIK
jgi:hypothetical protein